MIFWENWNQKKMVREYVSPQIKREKREKREKRDVGGGRVTSPARVGDGGSPSLSFSTSARLGVSWWRHSPIYRRIWIRVLLREASRFVSGLPTATSRLSLDSWWGVSTTVHGDSQLLDPGGGGSESSTIAAKDSEERRLFQLCAVVKFPGCRGVFCLASSALFCLGDLKVWFYFFRLCFCGFSLGFLEESPSGTVEALRCKEDNDCEAFSGVVVVKDYGWDLAKAIDALRYWNPMKHTVVYGDV